MLIPRLLLSFVKSVAGQQDCDVTFSFIARSVLKMFSLYCKDFVRVFNEMLTLIFQFDLLAVLYIFHRLLSEPYSNVLYSEKCQKTKVLSNML